MLALKQHAYKLIRKKLESGDIRAGSRLSDDALAREIGISRGPIREAISQLASEGLVEHKPRRVCARANPSEILVRIDGHENLLESRRGTVSIFA